MCQGQKKIKTEKSSEKDDNRRVGNNKEGGNAGRET